MTKYSWVASIWDASLSTKAKIVALRIAHHWNGDGAGAWPSYQHLADKTGLSRKSCVRAVQELEQAGFLVVEKRIHENGESTSNSYRWCNSDPTVVSDSPHVGTDSHHPVGTDSPPNYTTTSNNTINRGKAKEYAFEGHAFNLTPDDYKRWKEIYRGDDFDAELKGIDLWLASRPDPKRNNFFAASAMLHKKANEAKPKVQRRKGFNPGD